MGAGGYITLVNATNQDWVKSRQHSYQMDHWDFPDKIAAYTSTNVYIEWKEAFNNRSDDAGEANYRFDGGLSEFQIQARAEDHGDSIKYDIRIQFVSLETWNNTLHSTYSIGWKHDGYVPFILTGAYGSYISSIEYDASKWMREFHDVLSDKTLREICIPGTHDAGMSVRSSGTAFGFECNTLTQSHSVKKQLEFGSRYFDIRPVISGGEFRTGHYGNISDVDRTWQGANGQSIKSIIQDINDFASGRSELIILNLSHALNTDVGTVSYRAFTQEEWDRLFAEMSGIGHLYLGSGENLDISSIKLHDLLANGSTVAVIVEDADVNLGEYAGKGFFRYGSYNAYNNYSDTNNFEMMVSDQIAKMERFSHGSPTENGGKTCFLLSWTLTQSIAQASTCGVDLADSIKDLANKANDGLTRRLFPAITATRYPNVIYIDNIRDSVAAVLSIAIVNTVQRHSLADAAAPILTATATEEREWEDATGTASKFAGLLLDKSFYWTGCSVVVAGARNQSDFNVNIHFDGKSVHSESFTLHEDEEKTIELSVSGHVTINITGDVNKSSFFSGAGGKVTLTGTHDTNKKWKKQSNTWADETGGVSCVDGLFLDDGHDWKSCDILAEGKKDKNTGCMVTLVAGGAIPNGGAFGWEVIEGTDSRLWSMTIGKNTSLVVTGYITNHQLIGGGATITLTGYYYE
jgi:hypothetical protein